VHFCGAGMFVGRVNELKIMKEKLLQKDQQYPFLAVCTGRRRIGKSELIREFGKNYKNYIEIQGLAPAVGLESKDQIDNYMKEFCRQSNSPFVKVESWREAFLFTVHEIKNKHTILFLDEISWMGMNDPLFVSVLKQTFDTEFQKNKKLTVFICGSVSSWIADNILNSTNFVGRIHFNIKLKELPLADANLFFPKSISHEEKILFLCHTGGVPRYLQIHTKTKSVSSMIVNESFHREGIFFNEFKIIFNDIFQKRASVYNDLITTLKDGPKGVTEILKNLKLSQSGKYSGYLKDLVESGFLLEFESWDIASPFKKVKEKKFRITDNYLRFYLKQILPQEKKIKSNIYNVKDLFQIKNYQSFLGLQFENLVLNNLEKLLEIFSISGSEVIKFGPYIQNQNTKQKGCQIDYLIQTHHLLYIIEIKSGKLQAPVIIRDVEEKINRLKFPKKLGIKNILIHSDIKDSIDDEKLFEFFDMVVSIEDFLV
jgi:AAA+ ATPase superfamily predicted ATPase